MVYLARSDEGIRVRGAHPIDRRVDVVVGDIGTMANDHAEVRAESIPSILLNNLNHTRQNHFENPFVLSGRIVAVAGAVSSHNAKQ